MSRWLEETGGTRGADYDAAFRSLTASGADVHGEAAYVDALLREAGRSPGRVLDAGCGTGRVGAELQRRGHDVVGVDGDPSMLAVARHLTGPRCCSPTSRRWSCRTGSTWSSPPATWWSSSRRAPSRR